MKKIFQILLFIAIIALAYLSYQSINKPLEFGKIQEQRYERIIDQLKDIRKAQGAYKEVNGKYTGSFDTLISFIKTDSMPLIKSIGSLTDEQVEAGMTEKEAVKKGFITRDTIKISALDTIFGKEYAIENLKYVPFTKGQHEFKLGAGVFITGSQVKVQVFEARVSNMIIFEDIFEEYSEEIKELNGNRIRLNKYPGLMVGSLEEANNNAGNWE
ncbi:hypothetical protein GCQ56_12160 [Marinifilum sp. N1E240]|uniref:hypothetical protein n=1 Tax=Marinifilum sp. N1E240 TaxID=2608082 RepID=UPI00128B286C|nr:hypothetical protein [Marinifilum sp. N1E240]MPQ47755.1 hypothetical protein [Marinifilum sp. N1E240]|eukprot:TRINITY_DN3229_c0_g3_i1.p1 TRINITY_DN3229_c0_g3~~TRINITY_DN3229_c0_g3_i1.p1  ORF type:complete len:227 (+),score=29.51 TRINITY_DN3229_c0_g3_i1:41-682(+)